MSHRLLFGFLVCTLVACAKSVPDYQPDIQVGIQIHELATQAHRATYFTMSGQSRPVFSVQASPSGQVVLYVLSQRHDEIGSREPFQVLCSTAKLVVGNETFAPLKPTGQTTNQSDTWRIASCSDEATINGEDKLIGVLLQFESNKPFNDTFSLVLPQVDLGSGPIEQRRMTFSKRLLKEAWGIR